MSEKRPGKSGNTSPKPASRNSGRPKKHQANFSQSAPLAGTNRHVACKACRERKVRCGGGQPSCHGCLKRDQECVYAIPKDHNHANEEIANTLRVLTSRLARAEAEIAGQKARSSTSSETASSTTDSTDTFMSPNQPSFFTFPIQSSTQNTSIATDNQMPLIASSAPGKDESGSIENMTQDKKDDLTESYFTTPHVAFPMIYKDRFFRVLNTEHHKEETKSLIYAVFMHGAMCSQKNAALENYFYLHCRRHLEETELSEQRGDILSIDAAQACVLIALYEFKRMYFTRAWLSTARALRIVQMMRLHQLDSHFLATQGIYGHAVGNIGGPHWTNVEEERRRVFWVAYALDRLSNTGTDWPMTLDDSEITTLLPSHDLSDDQPEGSSSSSTMHQPLLPTTLPAVLASPAFPALTPFAGVLVMCSLWGRLVSHLYTHSAQPQHSLGHDPERSVPADDFWTRHFAIDAAVTHARTACCAHLSLPGPFAADPNALSLNLMAHTVTIYLHMAAVRHAEASGLAPGASAESEAKCTLAAMEIAAIVQMLPSGEVLAKANFFTARCLYSAARVLVQNVKKLHGDARLFESLHCLLSTMSAYKASNPLAELYVNQLSQDCEGNVQDPTFIPCPSGVSLV